MEPAMEWLSPNMIVALVSMLVVFAVAWGNERQARRDLERRHSSLAEESRRDTAELRASKVRLEDRLTQVDREVVALRERLEAFNHSLTDLRQSKASSESVDALREVIGRIDGKIESLMKLVTDLATRK